MKDRLERLTKEVIEDIEQDWIIRERFNAERHPFQSVDGDDEFEEE